MTNKEWVKLLNENDLWADIIDCVTKSMKIEPLNDIEYTYPHFIIAPDNIIKVKRKLEELVR